MKDFLAISIAAIFGANLRYLFSRFAAREFGPVFPYGTLIINILGTFHMRVNVILETARLRIRSYSEADIAELVPLIGAREVAATTGRIPHPYTVEDARHFLAKIEADREASLAVTLRDNGCLIGGIGLRLVEQHQQAELGYWLGVPYWGKGYGTEAAREMLRYGFEQLNLHRIFATHFKQNSASGRILNKLGMRYEGCQRGHFRKWDQFVDLELYGILRQEWQTLRELRLPEVRDRGGQEKEVRE